MERIVYTPYIKQNTPNYSLSNIPIVQLGTYEFSNKAKQPETQTTTAVDESEESPVSTITRGTITYKTNGMNIGNMQEVLDKFAESGISLRVTSGFRENAMTASGNRSNHAYGNAVDVTPGEGETWDTLRTKLKNSPTLIKWLQDKGYGILDETTPATMAMTKATGAHWHIGPDKKAISGLLTLIARYGGVLKAQQGTSIAYTPYNSPRLIEPGPQPYKRQFDLSYNPFKGNSVEKAQPQKSDLHQYDWNAEIVEQTPKQFEGFSDDEMEARQHWAETRFKNNQTSGAGAKGAFQIMQATWDEIVNKNHLKVDINNYDDNKLVRDIYMKDLQKFSVISKADGLIKKALTYAAYNMGPGNLRKFVDREAAKGIDVYKNLDWVDDLNPQTRNYVNFIVKGIDGPADLTNEAFKKALPNRFKDYVRTS